MTGPSLHLSWEELACHDPARTPYPVDWRDTRLPALVEVFEGIRADVGRPLIVLSAYRTLERNRLIGGARHSQHFQGRALDLEVPQEWTVEEFYERLVMLAHTTLPKMRGIGKYLWGCHVDVRPGRHLTLWTGSRRFADVAP